MKTKTE